jgi:hypothetical protein
MAGKSQEQNENLYYKGSGLLCDDHIRGVASFILKINITYFCEAFIHTDVCGHTNTLSVFQVWYETLH